MIRAIASTITPLQLGRCIPALSSLTRMPGIVTKLKMADWDMSCQGRNDERMIVEFSMLGAPKNWSNFMRNRFVVYEEKNEWLNSTIILGRVARVRMGCPVARKGHPLRMVTIHQVRTRLLDKDGLFISAKPIIDALKTELRKKVEGTFIKYEGAGLIFNDDPKHCDWTVTQELAGGRDQKITITVEVEETETI